MELTNSVPFKSKKPLITPKKKHHLPSSVADTVTTPDRANPPPRTRNLNFAFSISDVRKTSLLLQNQSGPNRPDLPAPARQMPNRSDKSLPSLPENYEMLCEFFGAMVNSIRLLRLKRLPSTFTKLCRNIEFLTDRRFTLHHFAQLKHVVPEVIMVKKIRVKDEETNCMKEELLVTVDADAVEGDQNAKGTTGFSHLKGVFRARISEYSADHPEGDDVPEGELPPLFYTKKDSESDVNGTPTSFAVSHMSPSFKRRFSSKTSSPLVPEFSPAKPSTCLLETPIKESASAKVESVSNSSIVGTPVELASTPSRLMASTPALRPPKRSLMSPDHVAENLSIKSAKRRSLRFDENHGDIEDQPSLVEDEVHNVQGSCASNDVLKVLPKNLLRSLMEKERKILEEQDPVVSQARRQKLLAGVPKLFDMICLLFQSSRCSVITKQEFVHKLVAGHLDIVDRSEIEEQLMLLKEVAPEYISEQSCLSGDVVLRINKSSCPESIRAKLFAAK